MNDGKTMDIVVKSVDISYEADSKGYYRPFYEFNVQIDGDNDDSILIDAMRYTRSLQSYRLTQNPLLRF